MLVILCFNSDDVDSPVLTAVQHGESDGNVTDDRDVDIEAVIEPNPAFDPPISSSLDLRQRDFTLTGFDESESYPVMLQAAFKGAKVSSDVDILLEVFSLSHCISELSTFTS